MDRVLCRSIKLCIFIGDVSWGVKWQPVEKQRSLDSSVFPPIKIWLVICFEVSFEATFEVKFWFEVCCLYCYIVKCEAQGSGMLASFSGERRMSKVLLGSSRHAHHCCRRSTFYCRNVNCI